MPYVAHVCGKLGLLIQVCQITLDQHDMHDAGLLYVGLVRTVNCRSSLMVYNVMLVTDLIKLWGSIYFALGSGL
jgi:hypothetical protein